MANGRKHIFQQAVDISELSEVVACVALAGEGCPVHPQFRMGEGYGSRRPLTPPILWNCLSCPLPQGERAQLQRPRSRKGSPVVPPMCMLRARSPGRQR